MADVALTHGPAAEKRRGEGLTAAALITPATIFVAFCLLAPLFILFRYSLNEFVPAKKLMVEAVTVANYVRFFTDPYYTSILATTVLPAWLGWLGVPIGIALLVGTLEFVGPNEPEGWPLAGTIVPIAYIAWSIWLIALGVLLAI